MGDTGLNSFATKLGMSTAAMTAQLLHFSFLCTDSNALWDFVLFCFRMGGEEAEKRFCEHKRLSMATLRMTWEAKVQLKDILMNSGFPEGDSAWT